MGKARVLGRYTEDNVIHFKLLSCVESKYGVDIPLSASQGIQIGDVANVLVGGVSALTGIASTIAGNPFGVPRTMYGIGSIASGIASIESSMDGIYTATSSIGMMVNHQLQKKLHCMFTERIVGDNTNDGRPLLRLRTPSSLGGFVKVQKGVVSLPASDDEMDIVNRQLETGFYYE